MPTSKPVKRSQLIGYFGVGAIMDFRGGESLMTAGLDEWPFAERSARPTGSFATSACKRGWE